MKSRIMTCVFPVFVVLVALACAGADGYLKDKEMAEEAWDTTAMMSPDTRNPEEDASMPDTMATAMKDFRSKAELARNLARGGAVPTEEVKEQYAEMAGLMEEILDHMYSTDNAYSFLQAKGLDTIIAPNLHIDYPQLRMPMLQLIRALFDIAPNATVKVMPNTILDRLVSIFDRDDDNSIKIEALELLSVWLPDNPKAQIRVLKIHGFEPFYRQLAKLEGPITKKTLELFNTLIDEHIAARNKKLQKNKADYKTFQLYQQIGLIERLSTPMMCNGLFKIFQDIFSFDLDKDILPPIFKLFQTIKPHCYKVFYNKPEVETLIKDILKYVQTPTERAGLEDVNVNVTEVVELLTDFFELVKKKPHNEL